MKTLLFCLALTVTTSASQAGAWQYDEDVDNMTSKPIKSASVLSSNRLEFGFPYAGSQQARLDIRAHPRYGRNVIVSVQKGHMLCDLQGCALLVRFDDGKPGSYQAVGPADHSTTSLFIRDHARFLRALLAAKRVRIEVSFYQSGNRALDFDVNGLKLDGSGAASPRASGAKSATKSAADRSMPAVGRSCLACHDPDRRIVGPSFRQIAERYSDGSSAISLAKSIKSGSVNKWGQIPMPPSPSVSEGEALILSVWILSLK